MKRPALLIVCVSVATLLAIAFTAVAPTQETRTSPDAAALEFDAVPVPGAAALRATIDPDTGRLGANTAPSDLKLDEKTRQALRRDADGLQKTYQPNGAVSVNLRGRFQSAAIARIDENGKLTICTEAAGEAEQITQGRPIGDPVPARREKVE